MPIEWHRFAIPKPVSRFSTKAQKRTAETQAQRECYAQVSLRDGYCCRVCKKAARTDAIGTLEKAHRHHLRYRSRGGTDTTDNIVLLCASCHAAVHDARIRLSGNADAERGVCLERATEFGWAVERWV